MSHKLIIRPEAEEELQEAFAWYEARVSGLGSEFLLCVDAVFNAVLRNPLQFPQIHRNIRRVLTRRFPYEVFFIIEEQRIIVLAVFHAKRNPKLWKERIN